MIGLSKYRGKRATIKSMSLDGEIKDVKHERGKDASLGVRFIVAGDDGKNYKCEPAEIKIHE
jgi:hypothetical protein